MDCISCIAEYFRIGSFLVLVVPPEAGLEFDRLARLFSWSKPAVGPWFGPIIEQVWRERPSLELVDEDLNWLKPYLLTCWVEDQNTYHRSRHMMHSRWAHVLHRSIIAVLTVTLGLVVWHLFGEYSGPSEHHLARDLTESILAFLAITATSIAAALNGYAGQQQHHRHAERFELMTEELEDIGNALDGATTMESLKVNVYRLRYVMLGEATDWYAGMYGQLMDVPT